MKVSSLCLGRPTFVSLGLGVALSLAGADSSLAKEIELFSPTQGGVTTGSSSVFVEVAPCSGLPRKARLQVVLDGERLEGTLRPLLYGKHWGLEIPSVLPGDHVLHVSGFCPGAETASAFFTSGITEVTRPAVLLARNYFAQRPADSMKWDWEDAVFLFGLERLATVLPEAEAKPFVSALQQFQRHWLMRGVPEIDRADRCPSALTALSLATHWGDARTIENAKKVADYVLHEPRNVLGAIDHLGHSWLRHLYPESIWVDSLMMYSVFATRWGQYVGDESLMEFGAVQPILFAMKLQDPETGFFRHAWLTKKERAVPKKEAFWLRGNAWVLASIVEILDVLPADHPKREALQGIFLKLARALSRTQLVTGEWDSLANLPGYSYPESSGTALVSYAVTRAVRQGWLDRSFLPMAERAFDAVTSRLVRTEAGLYSMPRISGPTNPISKLAYKLVSQTSDKGYGVGSYLLAAAEFELLKHDRKPGEGSGLGLAP